MKLELIEDKKSYDPSKTTDKVLVDDHRLMHVGWQRINVGLKWGDWNKEEIWNLHNRIAAEMRKRGFKHNIVDRKLDAMKFEELPVSGQIKTMISEFKTFVVSEEFISIVGSSAEGNQNANDVDITIKLKNPNKLIENKILENTEVKRILPDIHFIYDTKGSHGKHIAIYDLIAVKRGDIAISTAPQYSFPLFGAAPSNARLEQEDGICVAYLHKEGKRCELYDAEGNRFINYPYLEVEAANMPRPDTCIICGDLTSDGKLLVRDIFRWNSTELIDCPEIDRKFFLDKFEWTPNILRSFKQDAEVEFQERIILMQAFLPLKVRQGYGEYEFNNIDELIKFWANGEYLKTGIAIQEKADGFRIVWHKKGNLVKGFTEDKRRDRADMLPAIRDEIKKLSVNELIIDTEVVMYDSTGKPLPRHESMAIIASKTPITQPVKANIHDCIWYDGPKNDAPYSERIALAKKAAPKDTKHLRVMPTMIAHTENELRLHVGHAAKTSGSEGAMLKVINSSYPLSGRTPQWAKLKLVKEITIKVIGIRRKHAAGGGESKGTFLYRGAFISKNGKLEPLYSQHIMGPSDMKEETEWRMGEGFKNAVPGGYSYAETYASNVDAKIGQLITIAPIHILKFVGKDDKERFATMFPRMRNLETAKTKPDNYEQLSKLAALGEGSSKMSLEEVLKEITAADFPITIKEV